MNRYSVDHWAGDHGRGAVLADGRLVLRHWATIDRDLRLQRSTFDVEDADFPLDLGVVVCLARYHSWRY
jgi:hypothetical protein